MRLRMIVMVMKEQASFAHILVGLTQALDVITEAIFPIFLTRFWTCGCTKT